MRAVPELCKMLSSVHPEMVEPHLQKIVCLLLQQANEKIDRTRALACRMLHDLLHCKLVYHNYTYIALLLPFSFN